MTLTLDFAKSDEVATKADFEIVRHLLPNAILTKNAHQYPTTVKHSGKCWSLVMEIMYNPSSGTLQMYKKPKKFRNFRVFVEEVFKMLTHCVDFHEFCRNINIR